MDDIQKLIEKELNNLLQYDQNQIMEQVIKTVYETILKAERQEFLRNCNEPNKGNGFYERLARSMSNYINLKVPRDRLSQFKPEFLNVIKQENSQLEDLAFKLYVKGLSTRDIQDVFQDIYGKSFSPASISNITKDFQVEREAWQNRPLNEDYYFLYIDALWVALRRDTVEKEAFYIVLGVRPDLKREVLGVYNLPTESASGWQEVFQDLKNRGLKKVLMVVADGINSLENVIKKELPNTKLQKCLVHKVRNILLRARTKDKSAISEDFKKVFKMGDPNYTIEEGKANLEIFIAKWQRIYPLIGNKFKEELVEYYFSYLNFPYQIHRMIYTTNWIERLNRAVRKTENLRNSFPNPDSALNLICATLMDFEKRVYKYPITSFIDVQDELDIMFNNL